VNILAGYRADNSVLDRASFGCSPSILAEMASGEPVFFSADLLSLSIDELWRLREELSVMLAAKISRELEELGKRLESLNTGRPNARTDREALPSTRRRYPVVLPKYCNPAEPCETWSGRGKQPRWLTLQLSVGKQLDDFRIAPCKNVL
jgi:DNA-binding protein H-NS